MEIAPWQPGYVLDGRYELVKLVGQGGMGVVWRVHDREWGRDLALKLPKTAVLESPSLRERYVREAETWIGLGVHPHIVQCWFVTQIQGVPALFLDYLTGGSLANWMEEGHVRPGQWELIVEIAMQVAEGLAYAHSKGVIHRDVKPENLLVRGDERICVTDFGLVKTAVEETAVTPSGLLPEGVGVTCVGAFLGTPRYAAPEQWGAAERVGPPADMYALGVTLYEMCCGRRPFDTGDDVEPMDLIRRHLTDIPADPRKYNPNIPSDLAKLCLAMLEKDPARRPSQMVALRQSLHEIHHKLTRRKFRAATVMLGTESPDVLNNQAVSLHSLGKTQEAIETLRRGLNLDPGHPECLYNLVKLEKRSGRIGLLEGLRRLKQARAYYPLALLLIEQCMAEEALQALSEVSPQELSSPGLHHRARGDALMYLGDYEAAEEAYELAQQHLPRDAVTAHRRGLAAARRGYEPGGAILFPSPQPIDAQEGIDSRIQVLLDENAQGLIGVTQELAFYRSFDAARGTITVPRCSGAGRVSQAWVGGGRIAIADSRGYEFREVPSMQLLARREGRLLACSPGVDHAVAVEKGELSIYIAELGEFQALGMEGQKSHMGPLLAAFDSSGQRLAFLLPSGHLASLDDENNAAPQEWPPRVAGHQEAKCLALLENDVMVVGLANGTIRCYDLLKRTVEFEIDLAEVPRSLEACANDTRLIVRTARGEFFLLDRGGEILLTGDGPLAVSPGGRRLLVVSKGEQVLYNLNPFYELRRWPEKVKGAKSVAYSGDGRLAVVARVPGAYAVWEMDELSRAYQRDLLMSPGRGYADILSAHQQFQNHLEAARGALRRGDSLESHRHLQRARRVPGYGQGGPALDFAWKLLPTLKRDSLEAVWERLSIAGSFPGDIDLPPEGRDLLFSFGDTATLASEQDGSVRTAWAVRRPDRIRLARFMQGRERSYVLTVDRSGQVAQYDLEDGELLHEFSLQGGLVSRVALQGSTLIYLCRDGCLGLFSLTGGTPQFREFPQAHIRLFALWQGDKVLVTTADRLGLFDLSQPEAEMEPLRLGLEITKVPCFMEHIPERGLLVLGFTSGTLRILDTWGSGVLAALAHGEDNIVTSFQLVPELEVAVTTTAAGQIYFWDLRTQQPLEDFVAHRNGVTSSRTSQGGRYLLTTGNDGVVRYWETSWTAGADGEVPWLTRGKPAGRARR